MALVFARSTAPADRANAKQAAECMLKVLKTVPGVSDPKQGVIVGIPGQVLPAPGRVPRPYVEYRAAEDARWTTPTRFIFEYSNKSVIYFQAVLPGMVRVGTTPDTHVTDIVTKRWQARCGVQAAVLFE
jgi:hypothetical protein